MRGVVEGLAHRSGLWFLPSLLIFCLQYLPSMYCVLGMLLAQRIQGWAQSSLGPASTDLLAQSMVGTNTRLLWEHWWEASWGQGEEGCELPSDIGV